LDRIGGGSSGGIVVGDSKGEGRVSKCVEFSFEVQALELLKGEGGACLNSDKVTIGIEVTDLTEIRGGSGGNGVGEGLVGFALSG